MGKSAIDNLQDAKAIRKLAGELASADPSAATALRKEAHKKTMRAVKQMRTKPKNKAQGGGKAVI